MLLSILAASACVAPPPGVDRYACTQTNPTPGATFELRFSVDTGDSLVDVPVAARLFDLETDTVRVRTTDPLRRPELDLVDPNLDAWQIGEDDIAEYVLRLPDRPLEEQEDGVQIVEVFGGGRAQLVDEFVCELLPAHP